MRTRVLPSAFLSALLLAGAAGCSEFFVDPYDWGTVEVTVSLEDGTPVAGARLLLYSGTRHLGVAVTDEDGQHTFRFAPHAPLGVAVGSPEPHMEPPHQFVTFQMEEGMHREVAFTLSACAGTIRALVQDEDGAPVEGAGLSLYVPGEIIEQAVTDASGRHDFLDVTCGNYGIGLAAPEGFTAQEGPGGTWVDGLVVEKGSELDALFTVQRD